MLYAASFLGTLGKDKRLSVVDCVTFFFFVGSIVLALSMSSFFPCRLIASLALLLEIVGAAHVCILFLLHHYYRVDRFFAPPLLQG